MEFQNLIQTRRSVRSYAAPAPHDDIAAILKAAQQAPSWKNLQTARCYVAETPTVRRRCGRRDCRNSTGKTPPTRR